MNSEQNNKKKNLTEHTHKQTKYCLSTTCSMHVSRTFIHDYNAYKAKSLRHKDQVTLFWIHILFLFLISNFGLIFNR